MNIKVLGWYGNKNAGDNAFTLAFPILFPTHQFEFINTTNNIDFSTTDLIIVGGGDIMYSTYLKNLRSINVPKMAMSVTVTPGSDFANFDIFEQIVVREETSLALAGKYNSNVSYLPDFSFALTPDRERGKNLVYEKAEQVGVKLKSKIITTVINSYISYNDSNSLGRDIADFHRMIHGLADIIERMTDVSFIFLPFSTKLPFDDLSSCSWLAARCKKYPGKNLLVRDSIISPQDTLDMVSFGDATISTRLHSTIFSLLSSVPFTDLTHHDKNLGFLRTIKKEDWGNSFWALDFKRMEKLLTDFIRVGGAGSELSAITRRFKEQLTLGTKNLLR